MIRSQSRFLKLNVQNFSTKPLLSLAENVVNSTAKNSILPNGKQPPQNADMNHLLTIIFKQNS